MSELPLRPAQADILAYENGRLAVSAVPGSGKTFTLSLMAANLIADGKINVAGGQQILIVTFLNSSVDTFKARIRKRLEERGLEDGGFDVRTLHSLALEVVRNASSGLEVDAGPQVLDETQANHFLAMAVDSVIEAHSGVWHAFLTDNSPQMKIRWRNITEQTAKNFIRTAKNERYRAETILHKIEAEADNPNSPISQSPLLFLMGHIYGRYQTLLTRQGAMDFDDLIWEAVTILQERPSLAEQLRERWPYILEDEAQDSVPLQELLIQNLSGEAGNWVRVGDPNQAITSTFTAAHPRFFNAFNDRDDVVSKPLPNSGRSAPQILEAANAMLNWVMDQHPVPEVQANTFRRQMILPTPAGDAQPNPPDSESDIRIRVYKHREDEELPIVTKLAQQYAADLPEHTLAILVPTNFIGQQIADMLDELGANYDNLLRGSSREREIANALHAVLSVLANPLDRSAIANLHASLYELDHPVSGPLPSERIDQFQAILKSIHRPELFLFPWEDGDLERSLPANIATQDDLIVIEKLARFLQKTFELRPLPIDDLVLALGDELFAWDEVREADLAISYQIASLLRQWRDIQPDWQLPELVIELEGVATGKRHLPIRSITDFGYEPQPARITLATQHSAKGLEWDAVFLVGIDGGWIPSSLESYFQGVHSFLGGDPSAEAAAQLSYLMKGDAGLYNGRSATESIHIDIISERLRLLYVGITRAKRFLHISRSRATRQYSKDRESQPATVMGAIYAFLKERAGS
ncbi:MAG: ATP-dependent helicase [Chloroflexota bacterium]